MALAFPWLEDIVEIMMTISTFRFHLVVHMRSEKGNTVQENELLAKIRNELHFMKQQLVIFTSQFYSSLTHYFNDKKSSTSIKAKIIRLWLRVWSGVLSSFPSLNYGGSKSVSISELYMYHILLIKLWLKACTQ